MINRKILILLFTLLLISISIYYFIYINNKLENKLFNIHNKLNFNGNIKTELPEQLMTLKHLKSNDIVLELGGSIGRNSCIINYCLENKKNHVVIEPSNKELHILKHNRNINNLQFNIENSAISKFPLYSIGWKTYKEHVIGSTSVNITTYDDIKKKYNLNFNTLIIDCEGTFVNMLKEFPNILSNIRLVIIEHDFNSQDDLSFFYKTMANNNFSIHDKYLKNDKYGPGNNWRDGVKTDPIFISVWNKIL